MNVEESPGDLRAQALHLRCAAPTDIMFSRWYSYLNFWRDVRPGLTVEIASRDGSIFGTILEHDRQRMVIRPDGKAPSGDVSVRMATDKALLRASARVLSAPWTERDTIVLDRFERPERCERRRHPRLYDPVPIRIHPRDASDAERTVPSCNISGRGLLLSWEEQSPMTLGERLAMTVMLHPDKHIDVMGEVVRVTDRQAAVRFVEISPEDQDAIVGHIFRRESERFGYSTR